MEATKFKFLTALFSVSCICLMQGPSAQAQEAPPSSPAQIEKSSLQTCSVSTVDQNSFNYIAPKLFSLPAISIFKFSYERFIPAPPSKNFEIRTGLSPPILFA